MDYLTNILRRGQNYFGTGSHNSPEFNEFFEDFKKSFTNQLRKLRAKEISFSKGHFYLSGFFKVGDQYYYFSLSDVRTNYGRSRWDKQPQLLMRTAKSPEDYTGGGNNYVSIENGMYKEIAKTFRIELPKRSKAKDKTIEEIAQEVVKKGFADMYVGSMKKGNFIAWRVHKLISPNSNSMRISVSKYGRAIAYAKGSTEEMNYRYDAGYKRIQIQVYDKRINAKAFLKTLKKPATPEFRINPFTNEQVELEPLAVALYDYIKLSEIERSPLFQDALLIFREKYPDEYMTLLD